MARASTARLARRPFVPGAHLGRPELRTLTFPGQPLGVTIEIAPGADPAGDPGDWTWVDITDDVMVRDGGISITSGRGDESRVVDAGTLRTLLRNAGGKYSRLNPMSPYFGLLTRNTPVRVTVDPGLGPSVRAQQFITSWPPRWDASGNDQTVPITAAGVLRRLSQGSSSVVSSLTREITASSPVAYWPCEDGAGATSAASGIGGPAMDAVGAVTFAANSTAVGSNPIPTLGPTGHLVGAVSGTGTEWVTSLLVVVPAAPASNVTLAVWRTSGTVREWRWQLKATGDTMELAGYNASGTLVVSQSMGVNWATDGSVPHFGDAVVVELLLQQAGPDVDWTVNTWVQTGTGFSQMGTVTTATVGNVVAVSINPDGGLSNVAVGQVAAWNTFEGSVSFADSGRESEQAVTRIRRLCTERGIGLVTTPVTAGVPLKLGLPMGTQGAGTFLAVVRECEAVDGGVLLERGFGLEYQPLAARYNRSVDLALDYSQGHISGIEPDDDDSQLRNDWTVSRTGGSSARNLDSGSIATEGLYADSVTLNISDDSLLLDQASWRVHKGTDQSLRYRRIALDLARNPQLIGAWTTCQIGSRVTIANPPDDVPPDLVDLIIEGVTEEISTHRWLVTLSCAPYRPYEVFTVGDPRLGRLDSEGSLLTVGVDSDDVTLTVETTAGEPWTTAAGSFPFDINVGGEQMRVTNITSSTSPQTFTVVRSINTVSKSHTAQAPVSLWRPGVMALTPRLKDFPGF